MMYLKPLAPVILYSEGFNGLRIKFAGTAKLLKDRPMDSSALDNALISLKLAILVNDLFLAKPNSDSSTSEIIVGPICWHMR